MQKRPRKDHSGDQQHEGFTKSLDERKKSFEAKYARDREMVFKVNARHNKLLGLWAAELLGLEGEHARAYAMEVVEAGFNQADDGKVVEKVARDLAARGVEMSEHRIRRQSERLAIEAKAQLEKELAREDENGEDAS